MDTQTIYRDILVPCRNPRIIAKLKAAGVVVAHVTRINKLSPLMSTRALIWNGEGWMECHIPSHDFYEESLSPRTDPAFRGIQQRLTWKGLVPFQVLTGWIRGEAEWQRESYEIEDSDQLRLELCARLDPRIVVENGECVNWTHIRSDCHYWSRFESDREIDDHGVWELLTETDERLAKRAL